MHQTGRGHRLAACGHHCAVSWLQTSTDRFYPDFVGRLKDGRVFAVEYKSTRDWSNDDSKEKRQIGEIWAEASGRTCVFVMPKGPEWAGMDSAFAPPAPTR
jgi:type III restriction enzyme